MRIFTRHKLEFNDFLYDPQVQNLDSPNYDMYNEDENIWYNKRSNIPSLFKLE